MCHTFQNKAEMTDFGWFGFLPKLPSPYFCSLIRETAERRLKVEWVAFRKF